VTTTRAASAHGTPNNTATALIIAPALASRFLACDPCSPT
jgi:hypothetical protein